MGDTLVLNLNQITEGLLTQKDWSLFDYVLDQDLNTPSYSVVIPTSNRSPNSEIDLNPLSWCLDSLIYQSTVPDEIILVDDCSNDHTGRVAAHYQNVCDDLGIHFDYFRSDSKMNLPLARNKGLSLTKNDLVYLAEDDVVTKASALGIASYLLNSLALDYNASCLTLPLANRSTIPRFLASEDNFGKLVVKENSITLSNNLVSYFPLEQFFSGSAKVIETDEIMGPVMVRKSAIDSVGGYPYYPPHAYGTETGLAIRLMDNTAPLFYAPYNNLSSVHLRYGFSGGRASLNGPAWQTYSKVGLKEMVTRSIKPLSNTGCRLNSYTYYYFRIRNFGLAFAERSTKLRDLWFDQMQKVFVDNNALDGRENPVESYTVRKRIYDLALKHAFEPLDGYRLEEISSFLQF